MRPHATVGRTVHPGAADEDARLRAHRPGRGENLDPGVRPGRSAGDAVYAEKLREDAIRAQGFAVVRWTWADLADFERVARRLRATFRQA